MRSATDVSLAVGVLHCHHRQMFAVSEEEVAAIRSGPRSIVVANSRRPLSCAAGSRVSATTNRPDGVPGPSWDGDR
jgi:hypothetical protein